MAGLRRIAVIGSTGSIGRQTLEIIRAFPDCFKVTALAAGRNTVLLEEQAREFKPRYLFVQNGSGRPEHGEFISLEEMVSLPEVDIVLMAPAGLAGLKPTWLAAGAGKTIALANKESLVMAGSLIKQKLASSGGRILPVDSEHSAIWQCLKGEGQAVESITLTASGGPFLGYTPSRLAGVTPAQALKHPSWLMGPKVTIDSATLLNKGLEVIEAHHLFDIGYDKIRVLVHPSSLVHSMVEFVDGSIKAHLSYPDMRLPIQYALSYPERWANPSLPRIDWAGLGNLTFEEPDVRSFPCLELAVNAGRQGGTYPAALCGAGEAAVELFLNGEISFPRIAGLIEQVLDEHNSCRNPDLDTIEKAAITARNRAITISRE